MSKRCLLLTGAVTCMLVVVSGARALAQIAASQEQRPRRDVLRASMVDVVEEVGWIDDHTLWYEVRRAGGDTEHVRVDAQTGDREPLIDREHAASLLREALGMEAGPMPKLRLVHATSTHVDVLVDSQKDVARLDATSRTWSLVSASTMRQTQHPFLWARSQGRVAGSESAMIFVNDTMHSVALSWEQAGVERPYGTIAQGQTRSQHTFGGHRWIVRGKDDRIIFDGRALDNPSLVLLDMQLTEPTTPPMAIAERERVTFEEGKLVLVREGVQTILAQALANKDERWTGPAVWSPDRTRFVVRSHTPGSGREIVMIEAAPTDQVEPRLHRFEYLKPGDDMEIARPRLFDAVEGREIPLSIELAPHPRMLEDLEWSADSSGFSYIYTQRGHGVRRLIAVDRDGNARTVVEEMPPTFVDVTNASYFHRIPETDEAIWMSERDGWRHLYLVQHATGSANASALTQITSGDFVVRGVEHVDEQRRQIWFFAGGLHKEQDPYFLHLARVNFDGTGLTMLTEGNGTHSVEWSPDRSCFLARYSRADMPEVVEVRRATSGELVTTLERASLAPPQGTRWIVPQPFVAKGRDGTTDIWGVIVRPSSFEPGQTYPVIEHIYAGPHGAHVRKSFSPHWGTMSDLADLGFIVVQIDGMGTAHRNKAFHDICWKNLADAGFPDRIAWLRAAAILHPEMDLTRVGIYGGSAGGQNALGALLHHPDFYKVAAADCGCHDNRMDKLWWNEAWMGWPVDESYAQSSNVTHAHKLRVKLLLTVGELDRNVDPASTMQVVNALIQADKDFDLLVMPGVGHGAGETPYAARRRAAFFVQHLQQAPPPPR